MPVFNIEIALSHALELIWRYWTDTDCVDLRKPLFFLSVDIRLWSKEKRSCNLMSPDLLSA